MQRSELKPQMGVYGSHPETGLFGRILSNKNSVGTQLIKLPQLKIQLGAYGLWQAKNYTLLRLVQGKKVGVS